MRNTIILAAFVSMASALQAQTADSTSITGRPLVPSPEVLPGIAVGREESKSTFSVSASPTAQELSNLFVAVEMGQIDPFELIGEVSAKGEKAVEGLTEVLFSETIRGEVAEIPSDTTSGQVRKPRPNMLYAALCLRAIGSVSAYGVLFRSAESHPVTNVKALSLQSLATDYLFKTRNEDAVPEKEVVLLFLRAMEDSATSYFLNARIREIGLEGLRGWLGADIANEFQSAEMKSIDTDQWWQNNQGRLSWNSGKGRFEAN